jgi:hypothetical protein
MVYIAMMCFAILAAVSSAKFCPSDPPAQYGIVKTDRSSTDAHVRIGIEYFPSETFRPSPAEMEVVDHAVRWFSESLSTKSVEKITASLLP